MWRSIRGSSSFADVEAEKYEIGCELSPITEFLRKKVYSKLEF